MQCVRSTGVGRSDLGGSIGSCWRRGSPARARLASRSWRWRPATRRSRRNSRRGRWTWPSSWSPALMGPMRRSGETSGSPSSGRGTCWGACRAAVCCSLAWRASPLCWLRAASPHARSLAQDAGFDLADVRVEVRDWNSAFALVREGLGVTLVPEPTLLADCCGLGMLRPTKPLHRTFGLCASRGSAASPGVRALLNVAAAARDAGD